MALIQFTPLRRAARPVQPDVAGPPGGFSNFQVLQHFASQNAQDDRGVNIWLTGGVSIWLFLILLPPSAVFDLVYSSLKQLCNLCKLHLCHLCILSHSKGKLLLGLGVIPARKKPYPHGR